ncbi:hypothetical protein EsH8_XIII_000023 [Colletotrichum jinshuiense]
MRAGLVVGSVTTSEYLVFWQCGPRLTSSVNVHKYLPDLSFFVMLSSLTGMADKVSQANYAVSNTLQNALARHRAEWG